MVKAHKKFLTKMILNSLIWINCLFLSVLFVNPSYGQVNKESFSQKKKIHIFQTLKSKYGEIESGLSFKGFNFSRFTLNNNIECGKPDDFDFKFWIFLSKKLKIKNDWEKIVKKCAHNMDGQFLATLYYMDRNENNKIQLKEALSLYLIDSKDKKQIFELEKKIGLKKSINEIIPLFNTIIKDLKNKKKMEKFDEDQSQLFFFEREQIKSMANFEQGFFKNLIEALIYSKINNHAKAKTKISQILKIDLMELVFELNFSSQNQYKETYKNILIAVEMLSPKFKEDTEFKLLLNYLSLVEKNADIQKLINDFDANWSLNEVRNLSKSYRYGRNYLGFWFKVLNKRSFRIEVNEYLKKMLDEDSVKRHGDDILWIFKHFLPPDDKIRDGIYEGIYQKSKEKMIYSRFLILDLMEQNTIRKNLSKKIPLLKRPIFNLKRTFYLDLLGRGIAIDFSLYQLYLLGERNQEIFWKAIL